jgi:hypothetical protein
VRLLAAKTLAADGIPVHSEKENTGRGKSRILGERFKDRKEDFLVALETYIEK